MSALCNVGRHNWVYIGLKQEQRKCKRCKVVQLKYSPDSTWHEIEEEMSKALKSVLINLNQTRFDKEPIGSMRNRE